MSAEELLDGFDLTRDDLATPDRSLPLDVAVALFERARTLTGEPALGIYLGLQMQASAHGMVGFAAMSARTVRGSIRVAVAYTAIRTTALSLHTEVTGDIATLALVEHADLRGAREIYLFSILIGFWRMGSFLAGRSLEVSLDFKFPRPAYFDRFEDALPPTRFDQPANQLVLRDLAIVLDAPPLDGRSRVASPGPRQVRRALAVDGARRPPRAAGPRAAQRARGYAAVVERGRARASSVAPDVSQATRRGRSDVLVARRRRAQAAGAVASAIARAHRRGHRRAPRLPEHREFHARLPALDGQDTQRVPERGPRRVSACPHAGA